MLLKITNGSISYGNKNILEEINFELEEGEKVAIIGRNGCGKTSFLNAIIHSDLFDSGIGEEAYSIEKKKNISIGYLEQNAIKNEENTLEEELITVFSQFVQMQNELKHLEDYTKYEDMNREFSLKGGYEYLAQIHKMLPKFGFSLEDKNKKMKEFSGGEKTKIAFMKLLLGNDSVLLLDEPTNHLDIRTVEWLEDYLKSSSKAIIIVSHDRMFLDQIVTKVYDIEYGVLKKYVGNYTSYERQKKEFYEKTLKDYEFQQKEINRLQRIADRFRYKPSKASMAMSKLKKIEQMVKIEKPKEQDMRNIKMNFKVQKESGELVLSLKNLEFGYDSTLHQLSLQLHKKERLAILGSNGSGKSTLLKTLVGIIPKRNGHIEFGYHVEYAYFDQQISFENEEATVLEELEKMNLFETVLEVRSYLGKFLFTEEDVFKKIKFLSGGEKVRLSLAKILSREPNFLILDEPTNHVDLLGKQMIETCLKHYEGTILFVSHDRYFIQEVADSLLFLQETPFYFRGTYKEYLNQKKGEVVKESKANKTQKRVLEKINKNDLKKEIKKVETEISKLEQCLKNLEAEMLKEENFSDYKKMQELQKKIEFTQQMLDQHIITWEKLSLF